MPCACVSIGMMKLCMHGFVFPCVCLLCLYFGLCWPQCCSVSRRSSFSVSLFHSCLSVIHTHAREYTRIYTNAHAHTHIHIHVLIARTLCIQHVGSDDGRILFWEKDSGELSHVIEKADSYVVNVIQGHPTQCVLASSGIEVRY